MTTLLLLLFFIVVLATDKFSSLISKK